MCLALFGGLHEWKAPSISSAEVKGQCEPIFQGIIKAENIGRSISLRRFFYMIRAPYVSSPGCRDCLLTLH